jgi:hypothetical protein
VHPVPDPLNFFFLVVPGIEPGPPEAVFTQYCRNVFSASFVGTLFSA